MTDVTCAECGASFTPRAELLERYPGWKPRTCPPCYRAAKGGSSGPRGGGRKRASSPAQLTTDQALALPASGPATGLFTDGGCVPNPGPGGWGAVYVVDGDIVDETHGHDTSTTNNRMELTALLRGIELVPAGTPCTVFTDSNLAVRTITEWAQGWERRGWKRKTGPVENVDLVRPLYEAVRARPELELQWIRAHVGYRWNEYADALADRWQHER
ncbi:MAG: ribonuclease H [Nitriliruptor sp.]|uniref:ribonuclease H n=1 Tax=Nitriliruptor sp. TaxID=2448056 RepID=UPI0034A05E0F